MENFVEILKTVGKFLAIFIAKIVYYFVKGCIAFGKYCVIGFNFARKYVVKFIKEKQWEVVTAKFGKVKTSKWNQTKVSDGIESNGVNGKKPSWMNQSPKPVTYTPEESMDKAYRAERTTTPIVDPGHHAEKNKVTVKAVEEMSSFNGAVVVKESNAKPLPTHETVEEVPAVQETPAAPETIDNQATPEAHSEILNQVLGRAKRQSRLQNDEVVVQNDEVVVQNDEVVVQNDEIVVQDDVMVVNDDDVIVQADAIVVNEADVVAKDDEVAVHEADVVANDDDMIAQETDVVVKDDEVTQDVEVSAHEDDAVAQDEETFVNYDVNEEPAHIDDFTNISFAEEEPVQEPTIENQEETTPKISFGDISFVEPDEEQPTVEVVLETPEVTETPEAPENSSQRHPEIDSEFILERTDAPEALDAAEEVQQNDDDDLPFEPMSDALDFFDEPVSESPAQTAEPTPAETVVEEDPKTIAPEPAKPIVEGKLPSTSEESWGEFDLFKTAALEEESDNEPEVKEAKTGNGKSVEPDATDRYTEGSLFDF